MPSFNKVIILGNLTRDPEVKYIASGSAVCELGMAVSRQWFDKKANERKEETTFVDVSLWGKTAEIAGQYLTKGKPVLIEGYLKLDTWDDKQSGQKRSKLRVVGETMQMLGGKGGGGNSDVSGFYEQAEKKGKSAADSFYDMPAGDDIPF